VKRRLKIKRNPCIRMIKGIEITNRKPVIIRMKGMNITDNGTLRINKISNPKGIIIKSNRPARK